MKLHPLASLLLTLFICSRAVRADESEAPPIHIITPVSSDLIGWWAGDGNAIDFIGENNGRTYGDVKYVPGMVGQGFGFDGEKSFLKVPTSDLNPGVGKGLSLEMWVKPQDLKAIRPLAGWSASSTLGVCLWVEAATGGAATGDAATGGGPARLGVDLRDTQGASHRIISDSAIIEAGKWQHVALTYARETGLVSLYVDGKLVKERNLGAIDLQTSLDFYVGKHAYIEGGKAAFKGGVDEVSVYGRGLSSDEVKLIYAAKGAGKQLVSDTSRDLNKDQRWAATTKRLASFLAKHQGRAMTFASHIDGSDLIHIQGDKLWFVHQDWDLPGKNGGANNPTWVNGAEWFPNWNDKLSEKTTLNNALPQSGEFKLTIDALKVGGDINFQGIGSQITIEQQPTAENNYDAVLRLDDNSDGGPHWFVFCVSW